MSCNESIVENAAIAWFGEQGGGRVKSEIGRVKSWSSFPISLFTIHSCPALAWFGEQGYAVGHGPQLAPGEPAAERDGFGEVVLVGRLREAIRRLNPAIPEDAREEALHGGILSYQPDIIT